jgi:hypothetical protein
MKMTSKIANSRPSDTGLKDVGLYPLYGVALSPPTSLSRHSWDRWGLFWGVVGSSPTLGSLLIYVIGIANVAFFLLDSS